MIVILLMPLCDDDLSGASVALSAIHIWPLGIPAVVVAGEVQHSNCR